ncbi:MAG: metallophosphoesterase family protein, partial [Verrucomicrobia bacterium]
MWLALGCALPLFASDDIGLIRIGDPWRFSLDPPPPGWQQPDFDDSAWPEAPAAFTFAYSGYEATSLASVNRPYGAAFFRRRFAVPDPAAVEWLVLRLDWSGGGIVWLNGVELLRENLPGAPGEPVDPGLQPPLRNRTWPRLIDLSAWRDLLRPEGNCLAIEWHEHSTGGYSSALAMELLANFTRGPALQAAAPGRQTILWQTPVPTEGWVEYGPGEALVHVTPPTPPGTNHQLTLTNLGPGRTYSYRVVARSPDGRMAASKPRSFRVFNTSGPVRFAVMGDVGTGRPAQYTLAGRLREANPDLVLMVGDLVYPEFSRNRADFRWFSVYAEHLRTTPYFVVAGNHDVTYASDHSFLDHFAMPENGPILRERQAAHQGPEGHWAYSFDCGDVHFVGLYVPILLPDYDLPEDSDQIAWLEQDLAASNRPWKVVFLHHPLFSSGPHGNDDYNGNGLTDTVELGGRLLPLFQAHGVQFVFAGHDHIYERHTPWQGIQTIVTGAGGGSLYPIYRLEPTSLRAFSHSHVTLVTIDGPEAELVALDLEGRELDHAWYRREPPPADTLWTAARHTPADPTGLPPDGDGNRLGQTFDLVGKPIPGVTGRFAHPGRLRVEADATWVHLGLEGMALPEGDDLILFVGVQGRPGAQSLAGLGNGLPPPDDEGANALDLLGNLRFADGFEPVIACVLGDEFADDTDRFFTRPRRVVMGAAGEPNARLEQPAAMGQGVFRLEAGFPEVT